MGNFFKSSKLNTFILSCTLCIFTFHVVTPIQAANYQQGGINLNDIGFAVRIERLIKKVKKRMGSGLTF